MSRNEQFYVRSQGKMSKILWTKRSSTNVCCSKLCYVLQIIVTFTSNDIFVTCYQPWWTQQSTFEPCEENPLPTSVVETLVSLIYPYMGVNKAMLLKNWEWVVVKLVRRRLVMLFTDNRWITLCQGNRLLVSVNRTQEKIISWNYEWLFVTQLKSSNLCLPNN